MRHVWLQAFHTYGHEILMIPGLQLGERATVQKQSINHICDELQRHMALKARHHRRKPGIAIAMETVLVLLAFRSLKLSWALAPYKEEKKNSCIYM